MPKLISAHVIFNIFLLIIGTVDSFDFLHICSEYKKEYKNAYEALNKDARLCEDVVVCDNIDLDSILLEYSDYFFTRFNKYPKICKTADPMTTFLQNSETEKSRKKSLVHRSQGQLNKTTVLTDELTFPEENGKLGKTISELYPVGSELRELAESISKEILMESPKVSWDEIQGLEECKAQLKEASVYPAKYPDLFGGRLRPWKGVLMYGPPGTGKTMLAKAVASECHATFFNITSSSVVSKWRGESEKYVRVLLELAKRLAPSIVFVDEIDWTATGGGTAGGGEEARSEPSRRFRAELLSRLDGILDNANVLLLAATNTPWNLDAALLRRLEKQVLVDLPDAKTRRAILANYVKKTLLDNANLNELIEKTHGYSCADMQILCKEAWMAQLRPTWASLEKSQTFDFQKHKRGVVRDCIDDLDALWEATETVRPIAKSLAERYRRWKRRA